MSWCIGIDFGMRHWGLARGIYGIVEPITSIAAVGGIPNWDDLHSIVKPWFKGVWVIGIPKSSDQELLIAGRVLKRHWRTIKKNLGGKIVTVDETLTTIDAHQYLLSKKKKFNKSDIDAYSACFILKRYYELYPDLS